MNGKRIQIERPNMWLVYNERLQLFIHRNFKMVERMKKNGINEYQPRVTKVKGRMVYSETFVRIINIADRGKYWYIGYEPVGRDKGSFGFGYTRLYKNEVPKYGTIALIDATNIDVMTGMKKVAYR